jgi:membrane protein YdbS with pleckstrin-like domain
MLFENKELFMEEIPRAETVSFRPLDRKYLSALQLMWIILLTIMLALMVIPYLFIDSLVSAPWIIAGASLFILITFSISFTGIRSFQRKGYAIREHDLLYRSGWLFQAVHIVPFSRIQHVAVNSGPIDRKYGLAKVSFYTAAGEVLDIGIPGLPLDEAYNIKEFVVSRIKPTEKHEELG